MPKKALKQNSAPSKTFPNIIIEEPKLSIINEANNSQTHDVYGSPAMTKSPFAGTIIFEEEEKKPVIVEQEETQQPLKEIKVE